MRQRFDGGYSALGALLLIGATSLLPPNVEGAEPLLVMLQGDDLAAIESSVSQHGATITHRLPIISALGAQMTREQLDAILENTPGISRVIDDLAWEPDPDLQTNNECQLAGAIELTWNGTQADWVLFNKGTAPLTVTTLNISWPESLGQLRRASFKNKKISLKSDENKQNSAKTTLSQEITLPAQSAHALQLAFTQAPLNPLAAQNLMRISATADEDCGTSLARSYDHSRDDSYYPTVSGAALLHTHGVTGAGINVAVLDSGLWEKHSELSLDSAGNPRVHARYDAVRDEIVQEATDESGHGTHMTSVLARSGRVTRKDAPQPSYRGIAPDAGIIVVKAFGDSGEAGFLDIVRGIQWVVDQREALDIRILNLSFAARPRWPYWLDPVNQALMRAWQAGIFIAAAAGNEGPEPLSIGSPGNLPYLLTVGAITDRWTESDRSDDYVPDFSSRGPTPMGHIKPDLVALGGHMAGIVPPESALHREFPEYWLQSGEFVMTGTSQATALVSGFAALLLQLEPGLSNNELKCMLKTSAEPAIELDGRLAYSPFIQGDGQASLQRALTLGSKECAQSELNLSDELAGIDHFQGPAIFTETQPPTLPGGDLIISGPPTSEGSSKTLRWGSAAHLERLTENPENSPIDWRTIFLDEQRRVANLAAEPQ